MEFEEVAWDNPDDYNDEDECSQETVLTEYGGFKLGDKVKILGEFDGNDWCIDLVGEIKYMVHDDYDDVYLAHIYFDDKSEWWYEILIGEGQTPLFELNRPYNVELL